MLICIPIEPHALPGITFKGFLGKTGLSGKSLRLDLLYIQISHIEKKWYFRRGRMFEDFHSSEEELGALVTSLGSRGQEG